MKAEFNYSKREAEVYVVLIAHTNHPLQTATGKLHCKIQQVKCRAV